MLPLAAFFVTIYAVVLTVICVYGAHRYWMVWSYWRTRHRLEAKPPPAPDDSVPMPRVTIQLPMFNERHVARRVIEAACAVDYPADRLEVQVLDDSTDESGEIARETCERLAGAGHRVRYIHRDDRTGFKAGALANGLETAEGELIVVFDADFVPPVHVLRETVHRFTEPAGADLGMVQWRWSHLNRNRSLLTRVQAMYLDGHFVVEQAARAATGRWFNFNGTAGIWRRSCIDDAGGWRQDTLTEDTDLSYRAQMKGWRFEYMPGVTCPAEIPPTVSAFLTQQHRWNKGLMQTAIKLLPRIFRSDASLATKIEAWFHLTSPIVYVAILLLTTVASVVLVVQPSLPADVRLNTAVGLGIGLLSLMLGTIAACGFYITSQSAQGIPLISTILRLPALMAIGIGVSVTNTRAVLEALCGHRSPFIRTPKFAEAVSSTTDPAFRRDRRWLVPGTLEILLGGLLVVGLTLAVIQPHTLIGAPFLTLFACGYFAVGVPRLRESLAG